MRDGLRRSVKCSGFAYFSQCSRAGRILSSGCSLFIHSLAGLSPGVRVEYVIVGSETGLVNRECTQHVRRTQHVCKVLRRGL